MPDLTPVPYQLGVGASAIQIMGVAVPINMRQQTPPATRTGFDVARDTRQDVLGFRFDDWSGGFLATAGIYGAREKNRVYYNEGLVAVRPGLLTLPFVTTAQTNVAAVDVSGATAANRRIHAIMSSLGVNGARYLAAIGARSYIDTSLSNPAITTHTTFTDNVLSVANLRLNSTDYTAVSTDGTTNDTVGVTAITTAFTSGTELVTHANAADGFFAMDYFPSLGGGGWNVFIGPLNNVNGVWSAKSSASIPVTSSTMLPVVYEDTKDVESAGAVTLTTSATSPATGTTNPGSGQTENINYEFQYDTLTAETAEGFNSHWLPWTTPGNILSSNDSYATATFAHLEDGPTGNGFYVAGPVRILSDELVASDFDFSGVPKGALIIGIVIEIEAHENNAADNVLWSKVQLLVNGNEAGNNLADESEVTDSTNTYKTFGTSSTRAGISELTGEQVQRGLGVAIQFRSSEVLGGTGGVNVDHVRITLTYTLPGTQAALPKGGWSPGKPPHKANTLAYIHPVTDEETTIFKPHIVTMVDFEYDPEGDRILVTTTQPPIQMPNVAAACWYTGGLAIAGGTPGADPIQVKLIDNNNVVRDLGFPAVHGTAAVRVINLRAVGAVLMVTVAHADSTDCQLWYYFEQKWGVYGALGSKTLGGAMSTKPLYEAENTLNTHQNYLYTWYPSSTNTAVMRQFVPPDPLNADPFLVNTSIVKQDGPLYIQGLQLEPLPSEALNAILSTQLQSQKVDDNTSYGSVRVQMVTDGDVTFASPEVDHTFDAAAEAFTDRNIATSGDPGIAFKTLITRVSLNHQTGTAETPNGCTVQANLVSQWTPKMNFRVVLVDERKGFRAEQFYGPMELVQAIIAKVITKAPQAWSGNLRTPVMVTGFDMRLKQGGMATANTTWEMVEYADIQFAETVGALS